MRSYFTLLLLCLGWPALTADDFTRFRGADATGVAADHPDLPSQWNQTKNVDWVSDVPGQGWGSPIAVGDRVFVSSVVADEENIKPKGGLYLGKGVRDPAQGIHHWMVYCFDVNSGDELWKQEAHTGRPIVPRHPKSSYAAETPASDGQRLFVLFGDLGLYCYSLNGDLLWSKMIEPKKTNLDYGAAASPVIHDDQVIVVYDNKEDSWIAAFDAETGGQRWRTKRDETHSWATPFVWENDKRTEIVVPGQRVNRGYSPDGKELWSFDGDMSVLVIPSPFAAHGMCYLSSGYVGDAHRPTFAIRPGATGKIDTKDGFKKNEFIEWYHPQCSPYNTTQIVYGDYLYTVYDQGFMTCHNALTGEEVYGKQRFSPKGSFTASPWAYDGKVFCLSEDGLTYVIKAGPKFEILNTNSLDELCIATPSVVDGKLLVRTLTKVYCITEDNRKAAKASPGTSRWEPTIKQFEMNDAVMPPPKDAVLLVGGSNARRWTDVDDYFPRHQVINRGFGGARLTDVLHFSDRIVLPYMPKTILVNAGGNDLSSGRSPEQIRDTARAFITKVHGSLPDTRIYFLGLPIVRRASKSPEARAAIVAMNSLLSELAGTKENVGFIDLVPAFLDGDDKFRPDLFVDDGTHFSPDGYAVIKRLLDENL